MLVQIVYVCLFVLALAAAIMVVAVPSAIYSALYLVLTMVTMACLFVLLNAQLAAALQVIVYAGAIMILFLFVIMLLNLGREQVTHAPRRLMPVRVAGALLGAALVGQVAAAFFALRGSLPAPAPGMLDAIDIRDVAVLIITKYLYAFEMTSVLLLIAVVGAIVLARRRLIQGTAAEPLDDTTPTPGA